MKDEEVQAGEAFVVRVNSADRFSLSDQRAIVAVNVQEPKGVVTHHRGAYLKRILDAGALGSSALAPARSGEAVGKAPVDYRPMVSEKGLSRFRACCSSVVAVIVEVDDREFPAYSYVHVGFVLSTVPPD